MSALDQVWASFGISFDDSQLKKGNEAVSKVTDNLKKLGATLLSAAVVRGVQQFIVNSAEMGNALGQQSVRLGITANDLQAYRIAAEAAGVGSEQLTDVIKTLQQNAATALTDRNMAKRFRDLGVTFKDAGGHLLPMSQILDNVANAAGGIADPARRAAMLTQLMGEQGGAMNAAFAGGTASIAAARAELEELGGGASQDFIDASTSLTGNLGRQSTAMTGLRSSLALFLIPAYEKMIIASTKLVAGFNKIISTSRLLETTTVVLGIAFTALGVKAAWAGRKAILAWGKAVAPITLVALGVAGLILLMDDLQSYSSGEESLFGPMAENTKAWFDEMATGEGIVGNLMFALREMLRAASAVFVLGARVTNGLGITDFLIDENAPLDEQLSGHRAGMMAGKNNVAPLTPPTLGDQTPEQDAQLEVLRQRARAAGIGVPGESRGQSRRALAQGIAAPTRTAGSLGGTMIGALAQGLMRQSLSPIASPSTSASQRQNNRPSITQTNTISVSVSGQGLNEQEVARQVGIEVERRIEAANRDALDDQEGLAE